MTPPEDIAVAPEPVVPRVALRARRALSTEENWRQLLKFAVVGASEVPAQAVSVALTTPVNFAGNKLWTFGRSVPRVR